MATIALVDDDRNILASVSIALEAEGYRIDTYTDGASALKRIRGLGNDMALDPGMGNCGKAGQWVPVGVGQPTVLMDGLTVGGSAA